MIPTRMSIIATLFVFFFLFSCSNDSNPVPSDTTGIEVSDDLEVAEDFSFRTSNDIEISLQVLGFDQIPLTGVRFTVYEGDPDNGGVELSSGASDADGIYNSRAQINSFTTELHVRTAYGTVSVPVSGNSADYIWNTAN